MHKLFQEKITKLFGNVHFTKRIQKNGTKISLVSSKKLVSDVLRSCNMKTFRTKCYENGRFPETCLPKFIKKLSKKSKLRFLSTVFTADGSISVSVRWHKRNKTWEIRKRIELTCKHPELRQDYFTFIKNLEFSPRTSSINITMEKKADILKFAKSVRFVPGVKIGGDSKVWKGFEKNQILDLAVKTLYLRKQDLDRFRTKLEAIGFIKSFIHD